MRNQPKYNFLKNTNYALHGLKDMLKHETSFKIELLLTIGLIPIIIYIDMSITYKLLLFISLISVLIAETINSAIERVVDLVTIEYHEMAKRAKDIGSTIVFLSIILCLLTWLIIIIDISFI